jgi:hypothetical protein
MRSDNRDLIARNFKATAWIIDRCALGQKDVRRIKAHSEYFAAIYCQQDNRRRDSFRHLIRAVGIDGFKSKYLKTAIKTFLGEKIILKLTGMLSHE